MRVLFVCTGNICRSPAAESVFRHMAQQAGVTVTTDSAGTHGYHIGDAPDPRTCDSAAARGFNLRALRARKVTPADFKQFDLILAMDRGHLTHLQAMRPKDATAEVRLYLDFHPTLKAKDVPDPYYGGPDGFEEVMDLVEETSKALVAHARSSQDNG